MKMFTREKIIICTLPAAFLATGLAVWLHHPQAGNQPTLTKVVYSPSGFGGYVAAAPPRKAPGPAPTNTPALTAETAQASYNSGEYRQAEQQAQQVITAAYRSPDIIHLRQAVQARSVLAYSAARTHNLPLARQRFAELEDAAAVLPDRGKQQAQLGETAPTLTEEGAYEHAVCTAALGDQKGAEAEYLELMKRYPDSPLVQAAIKRIAWIHHGDIPKDAQLVWKQAMNTAQGHQKEQQTEASLCGPECLAELLRRRTFTEKRRDSPPRHQIHQDSPRKANDDETVKTLSAELKTDENGTSLEALASVARRHGFRPRGLALTQAGLLKQPLPAIALVSPGHYVLVEAANNAAVTTWDPDAQGIGKPAKRSVPVGEWGRMWGGYTLVLE